MELIRTDKKNGMDTTVKLTRKLVEELARELGTYSRYVMETFQGGHGVQGDFAYYEPKQ